MAAAPRVPGTWDLLDHSRWGDVDLDLLPAEAVRRCRAAWRALGAEPRAMVHGDPGAANIRRSPAGVGFFDWDEARVDAAILDLADLPAALAGDLPPARLDAARHAAGAWEAANARMLEPAYARRRLADV